MFAPPDGVRQLRWWCRKSAPVEYLHPVWWRWGAAGVVAVAALVVFSRDVPGVTASPSTLISCDFDSDVCSFTNGANELEWTYGSSSTPSYNTGPTTDYSGSG